MELSLLFWVLWPCSQSDSKTDIFLILKYSYHPFQPQVTFFCFYVYTVSCWCIFIHWTCFLLEVGVRENGNIFGKNQLLYICSKRAIQLTIYCQRTILLSTACKVLENSDLKCNSMHTQNWWWLCSVYIINTIIFFSWHHNSY